MRARHHRKIRGYRRSPWRGKEGPFSRFLVGNITALVCLHPFFTAAVPQFFDTEGRFNPGALNGCLRVPPARADTVAPSGTGP